MLPLATLIANATRGSHGIVVGVNYATLKFVRTLKCSQSRLIALRSMSFGSIARCELRASQTLACSTS